MTQQLSAEWIKYLWNASGNCSRPDKFCYLLSCLQKDQQDEFHFKVIKNVNQIEFAISQTNKHTRTITFSSPVSAKEALKEVESFLNVPMDEEYRSTISKDCITEDPKIRGHALGTSIWFEYYQIKNGVMTFSCGS
jgi:hypothetical protein